LKLGSDTLGATVRLISAALETVGVGARFTFLRLHISVEFLSAVCHAFALGVLEKAELAFLTSLSIDTLLAVYNAVLTFKTLGVVEFAVSARRHTIAVVGEQGRGALGASTLVGEAVQTLRVGTGQAVSFHIGEVFSAFFLALLGILYEGLFTFFTGGGVIADFAFGVAGLTLVSGGEVSFFGTAVHTLSVQDQRFS